MRRKLNPYNHPTADVLHIEFVELNKDKLDLQLRNLNSQQESHGNISNTLPPARIELPLSFSVFTLILDNMNSNKKDPV